MYLSVQCKGSIPSTMQEEEEEGEERREREGMRKERIKQSTCQLMC